MMLAPLTELTQKVVELPALPPGTDPIPFCNSQARAGFLGIRAAFQSGDPHDIADPTKLCVLCLQVIVMAETRNIIANDTCYRPVELNPQALGERAIVQVLAVPNAAPRQ